MALFDAKNFNGEVFGKFVDQIDNLNRNELLKSGAVKERKDIASLLPDQTGGNYCVIPIKARIAGTPSNYDGKTNISTESRKTYTQGRIVVGRSQGWTEKDFASDITGEDFLPAAQEVAEFWDDIDQQTILSTMKGIYGITGAKNLEFVNGHTYDISDSETNNKFDETTLNTAVQKALGDNKSKFRIAIMHSAVATNLENKQLVGYGKYTDAEGIQRDCTLYTLNGRIVLVDDNMPVEVIDATETTEGYLKYTTYVFGEGAIEYTDCGVKKPYSMSEDDKTNGGETTLWSRQRKVFAPTGLSFKKPTFISPTDAQLADGKNWELANSNESGTPEYFPHKAIPIARIITRG